MTEKELRKLNRYQLLELIIMQTEQIDQLQQQLQRTQEELEAQQIRICEAGSIAEAALQLSGIFEAAQSAADIYLSSLKHQTENAEAYMAEAEQKAKRILDDAQRQAEEMTKRAQSMLEETERKCAAREQATNFNIQNLDQLYQDRNE